MRGAERRSGKEWKREIEGDRETGREGDRGREMEKREREGESGRERGDIQLSVLCAGWRVNKRTSHPVGHLFYLHMKVKLSISAQGQYQCVHYNCAVEERGNWNLSNVNIYHEATQQQARATWPFSLHKIIILH